ncbi:hypothetical protein Cgig2_011030 [Carnegiea gigantea]|uniref:Uncharacterized protein n=1 Tax=Carnegiea gigantea TaxID=171969 RepID=A0A9Q1KFT2_9CARY|nr:hypothetical protein Cgig2_011030 [Carnegiea gigantea]
MNNDDPDAAFRSPGRQEADTRICCEPSVGNPEVKYAFFWNRDHKLGISTACLPPLYKAAKYKFMEALMAYKMHSNFSLKNDNRQSSFPFSETENEVMKHSKCLLLLSSDFGTAWNARKLILSKREEFSFSEELCLSAVVLSFAPKSENAWSYRRWIIKRIIGRCATLEKILKEESKLVEKIAEKSKMNYRAWYHRCWLISCMTSEQVRFCTEAASYCISIVGISGFSS